MADILQNLPPCDRVATVREKVREKNIFSRSWKSHGILLQVSENELF